MNALAWRKTSFRVQGSIPRNTTIRRILAEVLSDTNYNRDQERIITGMKAGNAYLGLLVRAETSYSDSTSKSWTTGTTMGANTEASGAIMNCITRAGNSVVALAKHRIRRNVDSFYLGPQIKLFDARAGVKEKRREELLKGDTFYLLPGMVGIAMLKRPSVNALLSSRATSDVAQDEEGFRAAFQTP
jgi:hypothetical protein